MLDASRGNPAMRLSMLVLLTTLLLAAALYGCDARDMRCTPFHKGYPLCGI
jgi:hypothetical protein